jgi:hypothetical protein
MGRLHEIAPDTAADDIPFHWLQGVRPLGSTSSSDPEPTDALPRLQCFPRAAQDHNDLFKTHFVSAVNNVTIDGVVQPAPTQLSWYPDGLGWQINVGKTVIRKSPEYRKLQQFLVYETDVVRRARSPLAQSRASLSPVSPH